MERREFFKRLGFTGAAIAVAPQILAEIQPTDDAIRGEDITVHLPDGRSIPCKSTILDITVPPRGGLYLGDDCIFHLFNWSLEIERPLIDVTRSPVFSTPMDPVPPWKEYLKGPVSSRISGSGQMVEEFIPWNMEDQLRIVLYNEDRVIDAEGYITALSFGATMGDATDNYFEFEVNGPITQTSRV